MALPKLQTSEYTLTLPSTQEEIKYRPFLVKEQKILMIAQESGEERQIADAIGTLVSNCTFGALDAITAPMFDVEYVFLQLRSKSVGAKVKLVVTCPDDEETKVDVEVDLDEINVQMSIEHSQEINITDDIMLKFRYPVLRDLQGLNSDFGDFEKAMIMIYECIESVVHGEETIHRIDMTKDEITEFIDSFTTEQLEEVMTFFTTMPKVRHVINVTNPKTKVKSEVLLEGLESFLV
jgi:hypothetical protein